MKARNYSRKREAVLEKIRSSNSHPTASSVFQMLRDEFPDLSLGTVYRNLLLFKEEGSILSVATVDGQERFDGFVKPHGHFICRKCGAIVNINLPEDQSEIIASQTQLQNCQVERVDYTAYGICNKCLDPV